MDRLVALHQRREKTYYYRVQYRLSWERVAEAMGYTTGRGAQDAAQMYAQEENKPWPVSSRSKGACIYLSRRHGMPWAKLARIYGESIKAVQACGYKWARRHDLAWPPNTDSAQEG
jgi:hypothetical protein